MAEKFVLSKIAELHDVRVNCAYVSTRYLAEVCLVGGKDPQRTCRLLLAKLEAKKMILRHKVVRSGGMGVGSQLSNEYELPGMKSTAVTEQMRQQVFRTARERVAVQMQLLPKTNAANEGDSPVMAASEDGSAANGSFDSAVGADAGAGAARPAKDESDVDISENLPPPGRYVSAPPEDKASALDLLLDDSSIYPYPLPPIGGVDCAKATAKALVMARQRQMQPQVQKQLQRRR